MVLAVGMLAVALAAAGGMAADQQGGTPAFTVGPPPHFEASPAPPFQPGGNPGPGVDPSLTSEPPAIDLPHGTGAASGPAVSGQPGLEDPQKKSKDKEKEPEDPGPFAAALMLPLAPFLVPQAVLQDNGGPAYFSRYPYDRVPGHLMVGPHPTDGQGLDFSGLWPWTKREVEGEDEDSDAVILDDWQADQRKQAQRFDLEYADSGSGLTRMSLHMMESQTDRMDSELHWDHFDDRRTIGHIDSFDLGDFNPFLFRFAQNQRVEFRAGCGLNWLADVRGAVFGVNFNYGMDYFPVRPWVLSSTIDWGLLGRTALFRGRTTVGVLYQGYEFYTGYEYLDIDRLTINSVIGGVRWWY